MPRLKKGLTKQRILEEAERIITSEGIEEFRLKDIAATLDIATPAIYAHYASKNDIMMELLRRGLERFPERFPYAGHEPRAALESGVRELAHYFHHYPVARYLYLQHVARPVGSKAHQKVWEDERPDRPHDAMLTRIRRIVGDGVKRGEFGRRVAAESLFGSIAGTIVTSLQNGVGKKRSSDVAMLVALNLLGR